MDTQTAMDEFYTAMDAATEMFSNRDTLAICDMHRAALARAEAAEAEALKQARRAAQARMRHANLLRRRGLEEPLTTVENEAEAAGLRARVAELEAFLGGDIQAVTADGQQHHIKRGDWRPLPPSLNEATTEAHP